MEGLKAGTLRGPRVWLVPYTAAFVPQYNEFLRDPLLQQQTASEPLSLSQEYLLCAELAQRPHSLTLVLVEAGAPHLMVGDVNVHVDAHEPHVAEVDVMVAAPAARRRGFATEALQLLMPACEAALGVRRWVARIKDDNEPSLALFARLGFVEVERSEVFCEVSLEKVVP